LYYSHHYENDEREITFLSLREYLETLHVPTGKEMRYGVFGQWVSRIPRQQRVADAHKLYEEFRGVITGSATDQPCRKFFQLRSEKMVDAFSLILPSSLKPDIAGQIENV
jgi:hypothetical protein